MNIAYYILNPTQNITLLVVTPTREPLQPFIAARLMELEPSAEQVGFLADGKLRMAGGEFCGNASMSAAALLCRDLKAGEFRSMHLTVSGANCKIPVAITSNADGSYTGTVTMPQPTEISTVTLEWNGEAFSAPAVRFHGITHLILESEMDRKTAEMAIKKWGAELQAAALGMMFLDAENTALTPLVYVPDARTTFWESSCASGTSAVGAYLFAKEKRPILRTFTEPGGRLTVEVDEITLRLTGRIEIVRYAEIDL